MKPLTILVIFLAIGSLSPPAQALEQPNGAEIPSQMGCSGGQPTGLAAVFACLCEEPDICNIGEFCSLPAEACDDGVNGTCETTIWHEPNDNDCIPSLLDGLDPWTEASTTPQRFSPVCPLTFTVVTRGTAIFQDAFGWYNVTDGPPDPSDLHVMLDCAAEPGQEVVLDIRGEADYRGGEIGFFLVTPENLDSASQCADGDCCATLERALDGDGQIFYSESAYNPDHAGADSLIHLVIYDSHVWPHRFYFAWEDIYGGSNNDFTDLVTSVSGVECAGGGAACDTELEGVCEHGVTQCIGEDLQCTQLYQPGSEVCDGLDNDCDGELDNDAPCPENEVCHNGRCVPHCFLSDEFACFWEFYCDADTGFCMEEACREVDCPSHQVCQGGYCVGGCDDVVCPWGSSCRLGSCVDPCEGVTCAGTQICREGVCVNGCGQCNGIVCEAPLECDAGTGECLDPSCSTPCAEGTHCESGACVDDCDGAVCPGGQLCAEGECRYPEEGEDGGVNGDDGTDVPDAGSPTDSGPDAETTDGVIGQDLTPTCQCEAAGARGAAGHLWLVLMVLVPFVRRRRR